MNQIRRGNGYPLPLRFAQIAEILRGKAVFTSYPAIPDLRTYREQ